MQDLTLVYPQCRTGYIQPAFPTVNLFYGNAAVFAIGVFDTGKHLFSAGMEKGSHLIGVIQKGQRVCGFEIQHHIGSFGRAEPVYKSHIAWFKVNDALPDLHGAPSLYMKNPPSQHKMTGYTRRRTPKSQRDSKFAEALSGTAFRRRKASSGLDGQDSDSLPLSKRLAPRCVLLQGADFHTQHIAVSAKKTTPLSRTALFIPFCPPILQNRRFRPNRRRLFCMGQAVKFHGLPSYWFAVCYG